MKTLLITGMTLMCAWTATADLQSEVKSALEKRILPDNAGITSYCAVFNEVEAADAAADAAWRNLRTRAAYDAYRKQMHAKYVQAIGGFPARTPLNAKVVARVPRTGYVIEKILFESRPGVFVTGLLYVPNAPAFKAPYPVVLVTCGHSGNGKGALDYQRGCVQAVQQGLAAFIYDPFGQGERTQVPDTNNTTGHNRFGTLAALVGRSTAQARIWDGMRAIDYLQSRSDLRADAVGYMGNSGGGTMTALITAIDPRVKASAPSCYVSSIREVYAHAGPQDAEQNVFGQLAFGLNHASLVLLNGAPVRLHCCYNDFFPFEGSRETLRTVMDAAASIGLDAARYGMTDVPGPHGWKESMRTSSVLWMRRWLAEDVPAKIDVDACRRLDIGFDVHAVDAGLANPDYNVTPEGAVARLPGFRSVYDYLKDDLDEALRSRHPLTAAERAQQVRARAGIRSPESCGAVWTELSREPRGDVMIVREAVSFPSGLRIPVLTFATRDGMKGPLLVLGEGERATRLKSVVEALEAGYTVAVADVMGTGEIGHLRHRFYDAPNADEEIAVMLYVLGRSLVGVRAEEILVLAEMFKKRLNQPVDIVAEGSTAPAAAHARAAVPGLIGAVRTESAPESWAAAVRGSSVFRFASVVNGGLLDYDWVDLLENARK